MINSLLITGRLYCDHNTAVEVVPWGPRCGFSFFFLSRVCWCCVKPSKGITHECITFDASLVVNVHMLQTERKYKEIVRDPLDADPDAEFAFTFVVSKLEPSLSYAFRIRAFNGYGPGQFTYKVFSCLPSKPPVPRLICATPTSLTIQYEFNKLFMQRMKELREIFDEIDRNNSGTVTRNELTDVMDEKISNYPHLRVLMTKIAVKEGMDPSQVK